MAEIKSGIEEKTVEPCTTQARRKQHWSADLAEVDRRRDVGGKGRTGHTLCGEFAQDEENTNARLAVWHGKPIVVADLPPCKRCAASRGVPIVEPPPEPWRFDVPAIPPHVTALKGRYGNVWVLAADGYWNPWSTLLGKVVAGWRPFEALLEEAPLVEHPDPRSTT